MDEEDETQSPQSRGDSLSPPPPPPPPIVPTHDVTSTKPPNQSPSRNALALVVHTPSSVVNKNGRSGGGGRDDCWSEEATKVLIEAWGERFSEPGKGTLKQQQWKEVAEVVNESRQCKYLKTDVQCKNRIDTVKKKYKQEKAKIASGDGPSKWVFFRKLEALIGGGGGGLGKAPMMGRRQVVNKGTGLKKGSDSMRWHFRKRSASETESESDDHDDEPEEADSAESLPPPPPPQPPSSKRFKRDELGGVEEVARAILGFTEAYEKAETAKLKLMLELEKERMKFAKEMELQRMQFLKTQMEITTQNNQEEVERSKPRINDEDDDRNVKNNGDVSS